VSWRRWFNPFLDASRELNVPARLADGERLYRDVVYHYGPAGPWVEGAALSVFGRRFAVLETLALLAAVLLLSSLWKLTARAGSPLAACVATTWAAALCFGAPNGGSFLFPYSFDALFALAASYLALDLAAQRCSRPRSVLAAAALAVAIACKPEVGFAAVLVLLICAWRGQDHVVGRRAVLAAAAGTGAALLLWGIAFLGVPRRDLSPEGPFALFSPPEQWRRVYRAVSGLADPGGSLASIATALFLIGVILGAAYAVSAVARGASLVPIAAWAILSAAVTGFLITAGAGIDDRLPPLLSPMPVAAGLAALVLLRLPLDATDRARWLLFGFSAACGARVLLGVAYGARTTPYSILAVPGLAASAAVLVLDRLPLERPVRETFRRLVAVVFLALGVLAVARWRRLLPPERDATLVTAAGSVRLSAEKAAVAAQTLSYLAKNARPGDTLSGAPEAGFFNFVTGLASPLRQEQILPGHLDAAGEDRVALRIDISGPRYFLLVNQPAPAFGAVAFGRDYAVGVWNAVQRRYRLAASFGEAPPDAPIGFPRFFIRVYERRPGGAP